MKPTAPQPAHDTRPPGPPASPVAPVPTVPTSSADAVQRFLTRLGQCLADDTLVRLQLARPQGAEPSLEKLLVRPVLLRGQAHLSLLWRHRSKDITKNLPLAAGLSEIARLLGADPDPSTGHLERQALFHHAHLVTTGHDVQLLWSRKGGFGLRVGKWAPAAPKTSDAAAAAIAAPDPSAARPAAAPLVDAGPALNTHDRPRQRALALDTPFLAALGITDAQHRLVPAMARKWRQINKFLEVLDHAIAASPLAHRDPCQPVRVLDFGAGKGYLTFAVHHHLASHGRTPDVTGVELRDELTALCNGAAARLRLPGLQFLTGDVRDHAPGDAPLDVMIALHACDTATDVAMHHGIQAGAAIILCSPCCHKELRPQMQAPPLLQPMLRHGIHMTEQAEMLTDSLRALLLQASGYDTQVFEFISPEHTGKNKMVLAVRRALPLGAGQRTRLLQQVADLKAHYGVSQQTLETLLHADGVAAGQG